MKLPQEISLLLLLSSFYLASAQTTHVSPEEGVIRAAYDHASYAVELETVDQYVFQGNQRAQAGSLDERLASRALQFRLSDFGKIDISQAGDLRNYVLEAASVGQPIIRLDSFPVAVSESPTLTLYESEAAAQWSDQQNVRGSVPYTLRDAALTWVKAIETFSVTVTLGGITKKYRSIALFGSNDCLIADPIFPSIEDFLGNSQYSLHPTLLLRSASYDSEVGRAYLRRTAGCTGYHCGASSEELDRRLRSPLHTSISAESSDLATPESASPDEAALPVR